MSGRTARRLRPAERRRQIVAAARTAIADRGLATMSLRDIAEAAGVSVGTVTYHFASVDEILGDLVLGESERFYADVIARADATDDPDAALLLLMEPMFADTDDARRHWRIWSDYWAVVARRPEVATAYDTRLRSWEECCTRIIERGVAGGRYRTVVPSEAALKLAAYSDGLGTQLTQRTGALDPATALAWMREFADRLLKPPDPS